MDWNLPRCRTVTVLSPGNVLVGDVLVIVLAAVAVTVLSPGVAMRW
jgi:hypothetical protein